jgi:SAM-dependent methyltransferase
MVEHAWGSSFDPIPAGNAVCTFAFVGYEDRREGGCEFCEMPVSLTATTKRSEGRIIFICGCQAGDWPMPRNPTDGEDIGLVDLNQCPICDGNPAPSPPVKKGDYEVAYCPECQLQFSMPMEEPGEEFYSSINLYGNRFRLLETEVLERNWRYATFFELACRAAGRNLLDIGCGDGAFLRIARERGFDISGVDIDPQAVDLARSLHDLSGVERLDWRDLAGTVRPRSFDVITVFDFLEHVSSPLLLLDTVFGLLRPGGWMFVSVPRLDRRPAVFDPELDLPPHHLTLWTSRALSSSLGRAGFEEVEIREKLLMASDLFMHLFWRSRRRIFTRMEDAGRPDGWSRLSRRNSISNPVRRTLALLGVVDKVLAWANLGKGHSLLAMGRRPRA